ncbi:Uncharacterised protein [uncultured archaeon]|nr:Uncharacterised protein [uncultured archaeon]
MKRTNLRRTTPRKPRRILRESSNHPLFKRKLKLLGELDEMEYKGNPLKVAPSRAMLLHVQIANIELKFGYPSRAAERFEAVAKTCRDLNLTNTSKKYFTKAGLLYRSSLEELAKSKPPISPLYSPDGSLSSAAKRTINEAINAFKAAGNNELVAETTKILTHEIDPVTLKPIKK